jgi:hypothetical protein
MEIYQLLSNREGLLSLELPTTDLIAIGTDQQRFNLQHILPAKLPFLRKAATFKLLARQMHYRG